MELLEPKQKVKPTLTHAVLYTYIQIKQHIYIDIYNIYIIIKKICGTILFLPVL